MTKRSLLLTGILLVLPAAARAEGEARDYAQAGIKLYDDGEYDQALAKLQEAEDRETKLERPERVLVHRYLAYTLVTLEKPMQAREEFQKMLALDPEIQLDPTLVSPKIVAALQEVLDARYPPPKAAAKASWMAPGWGQFKNGQPAKGVVFAGGTVLLLGNAIYQASNAGTAIGYAGEAGPLDKKKFQAQATRYEAIAGASVLALGAMWAAAGFEAKHAAHPHHATKVALVPSPDGLAVAIEVRR